MFFFISILLIELIAGFGKILLKFFPNIQKKSQLFQIIPAFFGYLLKLPEKN